MKISSVFNRKTLTLPALTMKYLNHEAEP